MTNLEIPVEFSGLGVSSALITTKEELISALRQSGHYDLKSERVTTWTGKSIDPSYYTFDYFCLKLSDPNLSSWDLCPMCRITPHPELKANFNAKVDVDVKDAVTTLEAQKLNLEQWVLDKLKSSYDPETFMIKQEDITGTKQNPNITPYDDDDEAANTPPSVWDWAQEQLKTKKEQLKTVGNENKPKLPEPTGVYSPKYTHLDQNTVYWMCYYKSKRYSVIFKTTDKAEDIPQDWPKTVKSTLERVINFNNIGTTHPGNTGMHLPRDPRFQQKVKHPITKKTDTLTNVIIELNDSHKWTFEQVADWLETLDDQPKFTLRRTEKQKESSIQQTARVDEMLST